MAPGGWKFYSWDERKKKKRKKKHYSSCSHCWAAKWTKWMNNASPSHLVMLKVDNQMTSDFWKMRLSRQFDFWTFKHTLKRVDHDSSGSTILMLIYSRQTYFSNVREDSPSHDKADAVSLFQDSFEFRHSVSARSLKGNLVWYSDDLDRFRIAGDLPVRHRDHVIQTQRFSWNFNTYN